MRSVSRRAGKKGRRRIDEPVSSDDVAVDDVGGDY